MKAVTWTKGDARISLFTTCSVTAVTSAAGIIQDWIRGCRERTVAGRLQL